MSKCDGKDFDKDECLGEGCDCEGCVDCGGDCDCDCCDEDEDIVVLTDENGKEEEFRVVYMVMYNENRYALLNPVNPMDDIGADEVIIYRIDDDGENLSPVESEEEVKAVYDIYEKEFNEYMANLGEDAE